MINQEQSREYTRCTRLQQFLTANEAVYDGFAPFKNEADNFSANLKTFGSLIPDKNNVTKGITTDKNALKQQIADEVGLICRKTCSYALTTGNDVLAAQVNTRPDKIFRMRDAGVQGFTTAIVNTITPLLGNADYIPYGITQPQLDAAQEDADAFNGMIGKADATGSTGTVANTAINKVIDALRLNIKHFDLLVDEFEDKNPEFVQGYHINSELGNVGVRHSGIEGYVRGGKGGDVISGATITLQNTTKSAVTDLNGYYHLDRVETGDYMVVCSADGYGTQTKLHHISRGKTDEMDWELGV